MNITEITRSTYSSFKMLPKTLLSFFCVFLIQVALFAANPPCPPGNPAGDPDCTDSDPSLPLDGGASLLIAAGIGFAAKKGYDFKKNKKDSLPN